MFLMQSSSEFWDLDGKNHACSNGEIGIWISGWTKSDGTFGYSGLSGFDTRFKLFQFAVECSHKGVIFFTETLLDKIKLKGTEEHEFEYRENLVFSAVVDLCDYQAYDAKTKLKRF